MATKSPIRPPTKPPAEPFTGSSPTKPSADAPIDIIESTIGAWGRWQLLQTFLLFANKFSIAYVALAHVVIAYEPPFSCVNETIKKCDPNCEEHIFVKDAYESTYVSEFDLVCDRTDLASTSQSLIMGGFLIGNILFGWLSDTYGRKIPLLITVVLQVVPGVMATFTFNLNAVMMLRTIQAIATGGMMLIPFVMLMEAIGLKYRAFVSIIYHIPFWVGHSLVGLYGFITQKWRWVQFIISIMSAPLILYIWFLPESPRWLIMKKKTEKAIKILESAAKMNKRPPEPVRGLVETQIAKATDEKPGRFWQLWKTKRLGITTTIVCFIWFAISMAFYGIAQLMGKVVEGDGRTEVFIRVSASGLFEIPGSIVSALLCEKMSRKNMLLMFNSAAGIVFFCIRFVPDKYNVYFGWFCEFCLAGSFSLIYLYTGELFPTVVRNSGLGIASMCARIGSMIAPFLVTGKIDKSIAAYVFGGVLVLSAIAGLLLPGTAGKTLPESIEESHERHKEERLSLLPTKS